MPNIEVKCPKCGAKEFKVEGPDPKPKDIFTCAKCGHSGTFEQIAAKDANKFIKDTFKKAFKGKA